MQEKHQKYNNKSIKFNNKRGIVKIKKSRGSKL